MPGKGIPRLGSSAEDVDALMYSIGELGEMDQALLLAQVANASSPEIQGRVDQFIEQAGERWSQLC